MQFARPAFATCQRRFGRGPVRVVDPQAEQRPGVLADLRLFSATFAAGFLFVSILIG